MASPFACIGMPTVKGMHASSGACMLPTPLFTAAPSCPHTTAASPWNKDVVQVGQDGHIDDATRQCIMKNLEIAELRRANEALQQQLHQAGCVVRERECNARARVLPHTVHTTITGAWYTWCCATRRRHRNVQGLIPCSHHRRTARWLSVPHVSCSTRSREQY